MNTSSRRLVLGLAVGVAMALSGCQTVHEVKIDAIRNPTAEPADSYRLEMSGANSRLDPAVVEATARSVREVLATQGMYEAPAGTAPEIVLHVETGVGPGQRKFIYQATVEPLYRVSRKDRKQIRVHEKFIKLSARRPVPRHLPPGTRGEEVWSVHVIVEDESEDLSKYLPVLTAALVDHVDDHAEQEKTIRIKEAQARAAVEQLAARGRELRPE